MVLILAILGASVYGISKKPASLPEVSYSNWICDQAGLLTQDARQTIQDYNTAWNDKYYAVAAVAAVDNIHGWKPEDYARELGAKWGLGANDMLLLLVKGGDWYVACGDDLADQMTDTQQTKLKTALDTPYYAGDYSQAAVDFFRQSDVVLAQTLGQSGSHQQPAQKREWQQPSAASGVSLSGVVLLIVGIFVIWSLLDRMRYNRYRRRPVVAGGPVYYPIFWGRRPRAPTPPAPSGSRRSYGRRSPASPASPVQRSPAWELFPALRRQLRRRLQVRRIRKSRRLWRRRTLLRRQPGRRLRRQGRLRRRTPLTHIFAQRSPSPPGWGIIISSKMAKMSSFCMAAFAIQKELICSLGFLIHQFDDSGLSSIAAADAGADDAGVAAVALGIFRSDLLEQLVGDGLSGNEAQRLTIGSQITLLAQGNHLFSQGLDFLGAGDGGLHPAIVQEIGDLLTEHRHTLIGSLTELTSSGHFSFLLVRICAQRRVSCSLRRPGTGPLPPACR